MVRWNSLAITLLCALHFALFAAALFWVAPAFAYRDSTVTWLAEHFWLAALSWLTVVRIFCWLARRDGLCIAAVLAVTVHLVMTAGVLMRLACPAPVVVT